MQAHPGSLVTQGIFYSEDKHQVISALIKVLTKLGRKGPDVDRKTGILKGKIVKGSLPWRATLAEIRVTAQPERTAVLIAITCEHDSEESRVYSIKAMRQLMRWLIAKEIQLTVLELGD